MTRVGNYTFTKTYEGYVLTTLEGKRIGTFPSAKAANDKAIALTAHAYRTRKASA